MPNRSKSGSRNSTRKRTANRELLESSLSRSDTAYKSLFDSNPQPMWIYDLETLAFLTVNEAAIGLYGYSQEEFLQMTLKDIRPAEDVNDLLHNIKTSHEVLQHSGVWWHCKKDGSVILVEITSHSVEWEGRPARLVLINDVTERQRAQEALKQNEARLRQIVEHSTNLFYSHTAQHVLTYVSPRSRYFFDCEPEEALIRWTNFVTDNPVNKDGFIFTQRAIDTGQAQPPYELELFTKTGRKLWVEVHESPVVVDGATVSIVGSLTDITARKRAENEVKVLERRFSAMLENIDLIAVLLDTQGKLIYGNEYLCHLLGYTREELLTQDWFALGVPPEERDIVRLQFAEIINLTSMSKSYENHISLLSGERRMIHWNSTVLKDADGQIIGTASIGQDITEQRRSAKMLEHRAEFEHMIAHISTLFALTSFDQLDATIDEMLLITGQFAKVDRSYIFMFNDDLTMMSNTHEWCDEGISPQIENLQNISLDMVPWWKRKILQFETIHIPDVENLPNEAETEKKIFQAQSIQSLVVVPMLAGRTVIGFMGFDSVRALKTWHEEDINLLNVLANILVSAMQRLKMETSLRLSEERYRMLIENARDVIYTLDDQGRILSLNPAFERITGWKREEWLNKEFEQIVHEEDRLIAKSNFVRSLTGETHSPFELRIYGKAGNDLTGEFTAAPIRKDEKVTGVFGIVRDISERKQLEERLRQAQKMESIGTLAGGVAHDFNNLLGIILGNIGLMELCLDQPEKLRRSITSVTKAVNRGAGLVQQMLTFARKTDFSLEKINVNQEIRELVKLLSETFPRIIELKVDLDERLPSIISDHTQLHQALLNLCVNARDAVLEKSGGGLIYLHTKMLAGKALREQFPEAEHETYLSISVSDTGIGMNETTRQRIFEPFFTTKEKGKGTGLGLAVVFGIIKSMNGFIDVESTPGIGTSFYLYIPVASENSAQMEVDERKPSAIPKGTETVLIVEDEDMIRELLKSTLVSQGYEVLTATNGYEAVDIFRGNHQLIDLVISDVGLPKLGGWEAYSKMKEINPDVLAILASGYLEPEMKSKILKSGVKEFISKPYAPLQILKTVREVLDGGK